MNRWWVFFTLFVIGLAALGVYYATKVPDGVEVMGGEDNALAVANISFAAAVLSLIASGISLIACLISAFSNRK